MPSEFIAVCGPSAVGKSSLLQKLAVDVQIRERMRICGTYKTFEEGLPAIQDIACADVDAVVWKWQFDSHHRIDELRLSFPTARHRALLLWLPIDKHAVGLEAKYKNRKDRYPPGTDLQAAVRKQWRDIRDLFSRYTNGPESGPPLQWAWMNAAAWTLEAPPGGDCWSYLIGR